VNRICIGDPFAERTLGIESSQIDVNWGELLANRLVGCIFEGDFVDEGDAELIDERQQLRSGFPCVLLLPENQIAEGLQNVCGRGEVLDSIVVSVIAFRSVACPVIVRSSA